MNSILLTAAGAGDPGQIVMWVFLGIIVVAMIAMIVISSQRNKKRQQEAENLINAVKPGNKVKTIGGICGIVVEIDNEENTFVLETGSETSGKCYIKFDKQAIYQTDAVPEGAEPEAAQPAEGSAEEASGDKIFEDVAEPETKTETETETESNPE